MDSVAPVFVLILIGMIAWMFEPDSPPPSPAEKYGKAAQELMEFVAENAKKE